jgi:ABC-type oligopeptide transport system ATPase subunit
MNAQDKPVITIKDLVVGFGDQTVLDHLSLEVRKGEILGVVGKSGGGKSVLLRTIIGLLPKRHGKIEVLASRYRTSREALVRRLVLARRTTNDFYQTKREQYRREYVALAQQRAEAGQGGFAPPSTMAFSTAGLLFTRLVLEGYNREAITASDVADYLDVRLKHLPKIERAMVRASR